MSCTCGMGTPYEQKILAIAKSVAKIIDAEIAVKDVARLSPAAETELMRLAQVLHETAVAVLEARDLLEKEAG